MTRTDCMQRCQKLFVGSHALTRDGPYEKLDSCMRDCSNRFGRAAVETSLAAPTGAAPTGAAPTRSSTGHVIECAPGARVHWDTTQTPIDLVNARIWSSKDDAMQRCERCARGLETTHGLRPNWSCRDDKATGKAGVWLMGCEYTQTCPAIAAPAGAPTPSDNSADATNGRCMSQCRQKKTGAGACAAASGGTTDSSLDEACRAGTSASSCHSDAGCTWTPAPDTSPKCDEPEGLISAWCAQFTTERQCQMSREPGMKLQSGGRPYCMWYPQGDGPPVDNPHADVKPCAQLRYGNC